eukprot:g7147.t1
MSLSWYRMTGTQDRADDVPNVARPHGRGFGPGGAYGPNGRPIDRNADLPKGPQRENGEPLDWYAECPSSNEYPCPTQYGWRYTGAWKPSRQAFYEKNTQDGEVLLDVYYTTMTVKTSMKHPKQGPNQLLGKMKRESPADFIAILENPRAHVDGRYRQREK